MTEQDPKTKRQFSWRGEDLVVEQSPELWTISYRDRETSARHLDHALRKALDLRSDRAIEVAVKLLGHHSTGELELAGGDPRS